MILKCKNCGRNMAFGEVFCAGCGTKRKKRKVLWILFLFLLVMVFLIGIWWVFHHFSDSKSFFETTSVSEIGYHYNEDGIPNFIDGQFSRKKIYNSDDVIVALKDIQDMMKFRDVENEFVLDYEEEVEGITYYRFQQVYDGIDVLYHNIVVSVDENHDILSFSGYYAPDISVEAGMEKSFIELEPMVLNYLGVGAKVIDHSLVLWKDDDVKLSYFVTGYSDVKCVYLIIDAYSGEVLSEGNLIHTFSYTGKGMDNQNYTIPMEEYMDHYRMRYRFVDEIRNIFITDYRNIGGNASIIVSGVLDLPPITVDINDGVMQVEDQNVSFIESAVTTMVHYGKIYDYYLHVLGRNSYDNKGGKIIVNLGVTNQTFSSEDFNNAFWLTLNNQMFVGNKDGKSYSASLDVLAHEFTHGVIRYTSNFAGLARKADRNKAFETGALNEGYADVLGSLIEGKNWTMAENNEVIRSAVHPESHYYPSVKGGEYYYPDGYLKEGRTLEEFLKKNNWEYVTDYDSGGIHVNSTVVSHAAYLMDKAGAFASREEMAKVWYHSLFLLSSYSNFEDCALAVIKTARNMGLNDVSISKITQAFIDTKMLDDEEYVVKGSVKGEDGVLNDVLINFYSIDEGLLEYSVVARKEGKYQVKVRPGVYKVKVSKDGYSEYNGTLVINKDTVFDIHLGTSGELVNKKECGADRCFNVTMYYLEATGNNSFDREYRTVSVADGFVLGSDFIVSNVNRIFGGEMISNEGDTFYITLGGFDVEFAWYYRGTDNKFDFNKPIHEDVEIEMKVSYDDFEMDDDSLLEWQKYLKNMYQ